jgi:hypothetical protein
MRHAFAASLVCACLVLDSSVYAQQRIPQSVTIVPAPQTTPAAPSSNLPKCDATCVRANAEKAAALCARRIEAQAPDDFEWITRPFTGIFQQAEPSTGAESIATYRGDSIRFMSPGKEWVRVSYECAFDVEQAVVSAVRVRRGRLDKPISGQAVGNPPPARTSQQPLASAPLAAAILNAARQGAAGQSATAARPAKVGEPSAVGISQVDSKRGNW